jgi:hypothetical protein
VPRYLTAKISPNAIYGTVEDVEQTRRISRVQQYKMFKLHPGLARKNGQRTLVDLPMLDAILAALPDANAAPSTPPKRRARS